jgi:hypothetical protein
VCCGDEYSVPTPYSFCDRCFSGKCRRCKMRVRAAIRGPGFQSDGRASAVDAMRLGLRRLAQWAGDGAHFTKSPNRSTVAPRVNSLDRQGRNSRAKRAHVGNGDPRDSHFYVASSLAAGRNLASPKATGGTTPSRC